MAKMFLRYFPEIAIGFVFFLFSIVLGVVTNNVLVTLFFALFSLIVSLLLIWMGQRISSAYSSHRTFEEFFLTISNGKGNRHHTSGISEEFSKMVEQAAKTLAASPPRAAIIKSQIEDLSRGVYVVANSAMIYDHNKEFLKYLRKGEIFLTTHVCQNSEEANFNSLLRAYENAAASKIRVIRIYIFKAYADITSGYWLQMKKLNQAGVSVRILLEQQMEHLAIEIEKRGVTLFGDCIVGVVDSNEKVTKATYIVKRPDTEEEFNRQADKLKQMEELSEELPAVVKNMSNEIKEMFI